MTAAVAYPDDITRCVRILCVGDHVAELLNIQYQLDTDFDFVIVACSGEGWPTHSSGIARAVSAPRRFHG